jgi:hypothetical protein
MGWGIGLSCLEYVLTACDDGRPTEQLVEDHGSAAMTFPGAKVPRLAAILTAGVLALACLAGSAKADTLPRFYIGKWCPEFEGSETFERAEQPSCGDKELTITSRGLVDAVYRCRFTRIRLGKAWPPATKTPMREWVREAHITARCATPPDSGVEGTLVIKLQIYKGGILDMWREPVYDRFSAFPSCSACFRRALRHAPPRNRNSRSGYFCGFSQNLRGRERRSLDRIGGLERALGEPDHCCRAAQLRLLRLPPAV